MPNAYVCDTYAAVAATPIDGGGYVTVPSGHTWSLLAGGSLLCDGAGHASEITGIAYETTSFTPAVDQRLRFVLHQTGTITTSEQIGGFLRYTPAAGGSYIAAFYGYDSGTGTWKCYAAAQVNGVVDTLQSATVSQLADGVVVDITVTGLGPNVVTFSANDVVIATINLTNAPFYVNSAGVLGLRHASAGLSPAHALEYGPTWIGPVSPTFTLTPGTTSLVAGGTTTVTPSHFNGTPTYSSSNTGVATVNSGGLVTAVGAGTCTITATDAVFADFTATTATITVAGLVVSPSSGSVVDAGTTLAITATLTGSSASLTASLTGLGSLSTTTPASGVPFTYTPPLSGTGSATVHVTDATDGLSGTCTVSYAPGPLVVTFPNADVSLSPALWDVSGGSATCYGTYGDLAGVVTGTTQIVVHVNTSGNSALSSTEMPTLAIRLNNGDLVYHQVPPSATSVTVATGLSTGTSYAFLIQVLGGDLTPGNSWTGQAAYLTITSLQFDSAAILAAPTVPADLMIIEGASVEQPYDGDPYTPGTTVYTTVVDPNFGWWNGLVLALNARLSVRGIGGAGWETAGISGYPTAFLSWWAQLDAAKPITWPALKYFLVHLGENDDNTSVSGATVQAAVAAWLAAARTALGTATWIGLVLPIHTATTARTAILAAVTAFADPKVVTLDPGPSFRAGFAGSASRYSDDGLHPTQRAYGYLDGILAQQLQAALGGSPTPTPTPTRTPDPRMATSTRT